MSPSPPLRRVLPSITKRAGRRVFSQLFRGRLPDCWPRRRASRRHRVSHHPSAAGACVSSVCSLRLSVGEGPPVPGRSSTTVSLDLDVAPVLRLAGLDGPSGLLQVAL